MQGIQASAKRCSADVDDIYFRLGYSRFYIEVFEYFQSAV